MWRRDDEEDDESRETRDDGPAEPSGGVERTTPAPDNRQAIIGESIEIQGEVTGDEDLTIQGRVTGSVTLEEGAVTVGPDGKVEADIVARVINVEGHVDGDLEADEKVVLRGPARVEGDISAPRVVLEDGSYFRGTVDMEKESERAGHGAGATLARRRSAASREETPEAYDGPAEEGEGEADTAAGATT